MALIKCPECKNDISDQALVCPKCGYDLNNKEETNKKEKLDNIKSKWNNKYLIALVIIIGLVVFMFVKNNNTNNGGTTGGGEVTPSPNNGYSIYTDSNLGISFEVPSNYKVATGKDGFIYIGKNFSNNGAIMPYIIVGRYNNFNNAVQFLNKFTDYMRGEYNDLTIVIDLLSGNIGNKLVYGLAYNYYVSNRLIVDNRYAFEINNRVYMVGTKEVDTNSEEINNVAKHIMETLVEGGA